MAGHGSSADAVMKVASKVEETTDLTREARHILLSRRRPAASSRFELRRIIITNVANLSHDDIRVGLPAEVFFEEWTATSGEAERRV